MIVTSRLPCLHGPGQIAASFRLPPQSSCLHGLPRDRAIPQESPKISGLSHPADILSGPTHNPYRVAMQNEVRNRPLFITGTSSGIGRALALHFAGDGHRVYATVRNNAHLRELEGVENLIPLVLDVRRPEAILSAVGRVRREGTGLYGLVNNAGIGGIGPHAAYTDEDLRDLFEVNVFGPHRMTNAFLPLLLESRGRIVNIGSQGGTITGKYLGPYTMTKHALEAYTESLAAELEPHGVLVSIVQPGGIVSAIGEKSDAATRARLGRTPVPFQEEARALLESLDQDDAFDENEPESAANRRPSSPDIVVEAVEDALFSPHPRRRYLVGTRWEGNRVVHALLDRLLDANESPHHRYTREELIALLDEHVEDRA